VSKKVCDGRYGKSGIGKKKKKKKKERKDVINISSVILTLHPYWALPQETILFSL
jgi:hypothetical protein